MVSDRSFRWALLGLAWFLFLVALFLPALPSPSLLAISLGFFYAPVFDFMIVDVFLSQFKSPGIPPLLVVAPAIIAFFLSPLFALRPPKRFLVPFWWTGRCALLLIWLLPAVWSSFFYSSGFRGSNLDAGSLLWGFYALACAHTMAFAACLLTPKYDDRPMASRKAGFPVMPPLPRR